jgi:hypothetical protein
MPVGNPNVSPPGNDPGGKGALLTGGLGTGAALLPPFPCDPPPESVSPISTAVSTAAPIAVRASDAPPVSGASRNPKRSQKKHSPLGSVSTSGLFRT